MSFKKLLANKKTDYIVVATQIAGPRTLFVALELFAFADDSSVTAIVSVDLDTLATELVYETDGETADYLHDDGWHGLVQAKRVIELVGGKARVTPTKLAGEAALHAIARKGGKTFVAGTKKSPTCAYFIDGFVAEVTGGKLAMRVATSQLPNVTEGELEVLCAGKTALYASGAAVSETDAWQSVLIELAGTTSKVQPCLRPVYALHETASGDILVGSDKQAMVIGKTTRTFDVPNQVRAIAEFRGTTYFASHDLDKKLQLHRNTEKGAKLAFKGKFHWIGYRSRAGRRDLKMCASEDLLVVSNNNRLHLFDGATWSQLAFTRDLDKLVKRMPVGMTK